MGGPEATFFFQFGILRGSVNVKACALTLKAIKEHACDFINTTCPDHGLSQLNERLLLFKHDYNSPNILQLVTNITEIVDKTVFEIVLAAQVPSDEFMVRPHVASPHFYKFPTFCDFCGKMLYGLAKQGMRCKGCGMNYHKRCVMKDPDCGQECNKKKSSTKLLKSSSSLGGADDNRPDNGTSSITDQNISSMVIPYVSTRMKIPHTFVARTYTLPTVCCHCKKLLRGLTKQGFQCKDCECNAHKKCIEKILQNCTANGHPDNELSDKSVGRCGGKHDDVNCETGSVPQA